MTAQGNACGVGDRPIALTGVERDAVFELGIRPTYALGCSVAVEGDVELMLANAALWTQAARITNAGRTGVIAGAVRDQIALLLDEAIAEALEDLEATRRARDLWRAGDALSGLPGLDADETEARYAAELDRGRRIFHGLNSLAAKLSLPGTQPPGTAAPALVARSPSGEGGARSALPGEALARRQADQRA
jgi:hypothetical protein